MIPRDATIDVTDEFPADLIDELVEMEMMGMRFPEEYEGGGLDHHGYALALAGTARGSGALSTHRRRPRAARPARRATDSNGR